MFLTHMYTITKTDEFPPFTFIFRIFFPFRHFCQKIYFTFQQETGGEQFVKLSFKRSFITQQKIDPDH